VKAETGIAPTPWQQSMLGKAKNKMKDNPRLHQAQLLMCLSLFADTRVVPLLFLIL